MAGQRSRQRAGHHPHGAGRLGRLVLVGLALLSACTAQPRDPTRWLGPGRDNPGSGGTLSALVGEWRATIFVAVGQDAQSWVTTWRFRADSSCQFRQDVSSVAEGITRTRERNCRWEALGGVITVRFTDDGEVMALPYSFKSLGTSILILQGVEHARIGG